MIGRVSDRAIHASVAALLPDVFATTDADWARTTAVQLAALAAHASRRPADPTESAEAELRDVLEAGGDESAVGAGGAVGADGTGGASGGWDGTDGDERHRATRRAAVDPRPTARRGTGEHVGADGRVPREARPWVTSPARCCAGSRAPST
jgi:hypothetical protein